MISDKDRSGWFGASDTYYIMGNWQTDSFKKWWLEKLGFRTSTLHTKAMDVGTVYEHKILDTIPGVVKDRQIIIPELKLRVNLDGETDIIHEVKTHKEPDFKVSKRYREQVVVQIYAAQKPAEIVAYRLTEDDYKNYFKEIDPDRLSHHPIEYDEKFIERYLPRLKYLKECMEKGVMPHDPQTERLPSQTPQNDD